MRIVVDLGTQKVVQGLGTASEISQVRFKRAPAAGIEVQFARDGIVVELPSDATGIFGVKPTGKYDDVYATAALAWVKTGTGENTVYSFTLSLINTVLDALFFVDGNPNNDLAQLTLMCELQWTTGGVTSKTPTLVLLLDNDVIRDGDVAPTIPAVAYAVYLPGITRLVGGTAIDLDAIPTVGLALGYILELLIDDGAGNLQWTPYILKTGAAGAGGVAPVDYHATTNNRHWQGATGPVGAAGVSGKTLRNGSGAPSAGLGVDGDFYIDPTAQLIYGPKAAGAWPAGVNYKGATGAAGGTGAAGPGVPTGGTTDQVLSKINGTDYNTHWVTPAGGGGPGDLIIIRDEKATASDGGTFLMSAWRIRDLNAVNLDTGSHVVSLASNVLTIPAGTYRCRIRCPSVGVGPNLARLYDVTNAAVIMEGSNDNSRVGTTTTSYCEIVGRFTLTANTAIRVEHKCTSTTATSGFGLATSFSGDAEVYTVAEFVKE